MVLLDKFRNKKTDTQINPRVTTANDFVNVKDIKNSVLYTKDGHVFAYIRVPPIALELISEAEKESIIRNLSVELSTEQKPFKFFAISRPVNISGLIDDLTDAYMVAETPQQKELLKKSIETINGFALSGDVIERQFYFIIWEKYYDGCHDDIIERAKELCSKLSCVQRDVSILSDNEIVQLCNLFANPSYSHFEDGEILPSITIMGGKI
ncbi:MAG: hypothetical protein PHV07_00760 [Oscillospiraceae bacterium]|nr:hypothetical protein [Oscillospiraceae bacterium]